MGRRRRLLIMFACSYSRSDWLRAKVVVKLLFLGWILVNTTNCKLRDINDVGTIEILRHFIWFKWGVGAVSTFPACCWSIKWTCNSLKLSLDKVRDGSQSDYVLESFCNVQIIFAQPAPSVETDLVFGAENDASGRLTAVIRIMTCTRTGGCWTVGLHQRLSNAIL